MCEAVTKDDGGQCFRVVRSFGVVCSVLILVDFECLCVNTTFEVVLVIRHFGGACEVGGCSQLTAWQTAGMACNCQNSWSCRSAGGCSGILTNKECTSEQRWSMAPGGGLWERSWRYEHCRHRQKLMSVQKGYIDTTEKRLFIQRGRDTTQRNGNGGEKGEDAVARIWAKLPEEINQNAKVPWNLATSCWDKTIRCILLMNVVSVWVEGQVSTDKTKCEGCDKQRDFSE